MRQNSKPLIEEDPIVIQRKMARLFGIDEDDVRVTMLNFGPEKKVAYIRLVWTPEGYMPEPPKKEKRRG